MIALLIGWLVFAATLVHPLRRYMLHDFHPAPWWKMPLPWLLASGFALLWPVWVLLLARKSFLTKTLSRG